MGIATDSASSDATSTNSGLVLTTDANDGSTYIFVSRVSADVERLETLLKEQEFIDLVSPSFGYALDDDTFIVYSNLEYNKIALLSNETISAGQYELFVTNKGYDASINKTKVEIKIKS